MKWGKEEAIEAIKTVQDPDWGMDIWRLGFVQSLDVFGKDVKIGLKLSCPGCPIAGTIVENLKMALFDKGFEKVDVDLMLDSPWEPSDEVEAMLR